MSLIGRNGARAPRKGAPVPDTQPTRSEDVYPETAEYSRMSWAQRNDPGMYGSYATDHRNRKLHAGKRTNDSVGWTIYPNY